MGERNNRDWDRNRHGRDGYGLGDALRDMQKERRQDERTAREYCSDFGENAVISAPPGSDIAGIQAHAEASCLRSYGLVPHDVLPVPPLAPSVTPMLPRDNSPLRLPD